MLVIKNFRSYLYNLLVSFILKKLWQDGYKNWLQESKTKQNKIILLFTTLKSKVYFLTFLSKLTIKNIFGLSLDFKIFLQFCCFVKLKHFDFDLYFFNKTKINASYIKNQKPGQFFCCIIENIWIESIKISTRK